MRDDTDQPPAPARRTGTRPRNTSSVLIGLIALISAIEVILLLADLGLIGSARWRPLSYQYGAFWAGLLQDWRPNYAAQPVAMFFTYAFLHAGPGHLTGNMLTLFWLGKTAAARLGNAHFALLYLASMLGGGAAFGMLSRSPAPMVGASGAIMGLAAAWIVWDWQDRRKSGARGWAAARWAVGMTFALGGLNLGVWVWLNGILAWQTHLGGFLSGAAMALILRRR